MDIKILKKDGQNLELKAQPETFLMVFMIIWSTGFGGIPLTMLPILALEIVSNLGTKTLTCQKTIPDQINCQEKQEMWLGYGQTLVKDLPPIKKAKFNQQISKGSKGQTFETNWLTLVTDQEEIALFETETNTKGLTEDATFLKNWTNQINSFLTSGESTLTLEYPLSKQWFNIFPLLFMIPFPLIASGVLFFTLQTHKLTFDRLSRQIIHHHQTLLGLKVKTFDWHSITGLTLTKRRGNKGATYYQLKFLTNAPSSLPSLTTNKAIILQEIGQEIASLLKVNLDDRSNYFT